MPGYSNLEPIFPFLPAHFPPSALSVWLRSCLLDASFVSSQRGSSKSLTLFISWCFELRPVNWPSICQDSHWSDLKGFCPMELRSQDGNYGGAIKRGFSSKEIRTSPNSA